MRLQQIPVNKQRTFRVLIRGRAIYWLSLEDVLICPKSAAERKRRLPKRS